MTANLDDPEGIQRAHKWGERAIACLMDAGLLERVEPHKTLHPVDERGEVSGVFLPLCEPFLARLVVSLLDGYLSRAARHMDALHKSPPPH